MAEPVKKSEEVERALTDVFGFDRRDSIRANECAPIGCGKPINPDEFHDPVEVREYKISGLCGPCQRKFFGTQNYEEE